MPVVSGSLAIFSGSAPAMQAAVTWVRAEAQPAVMYPHSAPVSSANLTPTRSMSSSRCT